MRVAARRRLAVAAPLAFVPGGGPKPKAYAESSRLSSAMPLPSICKSMRSSGMRLTRPVTPAFVSRTHLAPVNRQPDFGSLRRLPFRLAVRASSTSSGSRAGPTPSANRN